LIWLASYDSGYAIPAGRIQTILAYVGSRSFGLYVIHIVAVFIVRAIQNTTTKADETGIFGLLIVFWAFALAEVNFRFFEVPLRNYGRRAADRVAIKFIRQELPQSNPSQTSATVAVP